MILPVISVNPNRDSPNGYPTVTPAELQPVTLAHKVDAHKTVTAHKLACSCFVALLWSSVISLYSLRSYNSMTQTLQLKMQQSNRKHSGASDNSLTTTPSTK